MCTLRLLTVLLFFVASSCFSQSQPGLHTLPDADSAFIRKFNWTNDIRFFYGLQGNNSSLGSKRDDGTRINGDLYQNTNDYIGAGITYGWLDGDISYSIKGTTYLKEERSNLTQLKLSFSYTRRRIVFRPYYSNSEGMVVSDSENEFESTPSLHDTRLGMQVTYLFNSSKYSYRAAMYQTEYQLKTAGSFLLRLDPFYRRLGAKTGMIPSAYDQVSRYGEQTGLQYIKSPGLLVSPGYGINIALRDPRFFISPMVFAGIGFAQNKYETTHGKGSYTSLEYGANMMLNAGYNGIRYYSRLQFNWSAGYTVLNPTYLTNS